MDIMQQSACMVINQIMCVCGGGGGGGGGVFVLWCSGR